MLVEKTDRLYRNLRDWVTIDDLDAEIHLAKENGYIVSKAVSKLDRGYDDYVEGRIPRTSGPGNRSSGRTSGGRSRPKSPGSTGRARRWRSPARRF